MPCAASALCAVLAASRRARCVVVGWFLLFAGGGGLRALRCLARPLCRARSRQLLWWVWVGLSVGCGGFLGAVWAASLCGRRGAVGWAAWRAGLIGAAPGVEWWVGCVWRTGAACAVCAAGVVRWVGFCYLRAVRGSILRGLARPPYVARSRRLLRSACAAFSRLRNLGLIADRLVECWLLSRCVAFAGFDISLSVYISPNSTAISGFATRIGLKG